MKKSSSLASELVTPASLTLISSFASTSPPLANLTVQHYTSLHDPPFRSFANHTLSPHQSPLPSIIILKLSQKCLSYLRLLVLTRIFLLGFKSCYWNLKRGSIFLNFKLRSTLCTLSKLVLVRKKISTLLTSRTDVPSKLVFFVLANFLSPAADERIVLRREGDIVLFFFSNIRHYLFSGL